jgi:hypothetical protein
MFSGGGSLWLRVASVGDTQRVIYARNFVADNVTVGFGFAFYIQATPLRPSFLDATFSSAKPEQNLPLWADFHLRLGK